MSVTFKRVVHFGHSRRCEHLRRQTPLEPLPGEVQLLRYELSPWIRSVGIIYSTASTPCAFSCARGAFSAECYASFVEALLPVLEGFDCFDGTSPHYHFVPTIGRAIDSTGAIPGAAPSPTLRALSSGKRVSPRTIIKAAYLIVSHKFPAVPTPAASLPVPSSAGSTRDPLHAT